MVFESGVKDRIRRLLQQAIPILCRSGLSLADSFEVEGLIGITFAENDVLLVSIKDTVDASKSYDISDCFNGILKERSSPNRKRLRSSCDSEGSSYTPDPNLGISFFTRILYHIVNFLYNSRFKEKKV